MSSELWKPFVCATIIAIAIATVLFAVIESGAGYDVCLQDSSPLTVIELESWECEELRYCIELGWAGNEYHQFENVYVQRCMK